VWLAGTHEAAGRFVERYLFQCARTVLSETEAAGVLLGVAEDYFRRVAPA
jgi:hypothetical protein